jgi:hypothetical protein
MDTRKKKEVSPTGSAARSIVSRLEGQACITSSGEMPVMARLGKTQCRVLLAIHHAENKESYITRIKEYLEKRYKEEINIGQLSNITKALEHFKLIRGRRGGMPSGAGRPITLFRVTPLGYTAMRQTAEYIDALEAAERDARPDAQETEARRDGRPRSSRPH